MIIKGYEEKLDDRDIRYINYVIDKSTMADAIESYIKDLDCTIIYPDGSRPRQTINGLRCIITAYTQNDMFKPVRFRFQSREGLTWHTLGYLEDYLLATINTNIIDDMINGFAALDGEVYLPGYTVNQINHFVKDTNCVQNKLL
jgi:hypothetical protein